MPVTFINSGRFGAPAAFSPLDLSPALWLDASDSSTITIATGVSQWDDKSGNARHFTQATAGNQPALTSAGQNGLDVVTFDGADDWMTAGDVLDLGTSSFSMFAVVKFSAIATNSAAVLIGKWKVGPADGAWIYHRVDTTGTENNKPMYRNASTSSSAIGSATTTTVADVYGMIIDRAAGSITSRARSATDGTGSFTADSATSRDIPTSVYMGALRDSADTGFQAGFWFGGFICELVICLSALGTTDRDALESYLKAKWATP